MPISEIADFPPMVRFEATTGAGSYIQEADTSARDPVIGATMIPVYRVAALIAGGMTYDQVAEDFPSLTKGEIIDAWHYSLAHPAPPDIRYPRQSLKRLLRGSGFSSPRTRPRSRARR